MTARPSLITHTLLFLLVAFLIGCAGYFLWQTIHLEKKVDTLLVDRQYFMNEYSSSSALLESQRATIADLTNALATAETTLRETENQLRAEARRNDDFAQQIADLGETVGVLDKLAKTDEELLQKYSKVYFLNENYRPERLTQIPSRYILPGKKDQYFHADAWPFLQLMLDDAAEADVALQVISAFRSFDEQTELKDQFTQQYGSGANTFSADQGFSEHQLGTAVDLTDRATGRTSQTFAATAAYAWLQENAHKYGFILSYPEGNAFYIFEPWHWRFVGIDLARDLHRDGAHFYDWDQRKIDEYLVSIFE
jgi:D-alanyl-D-alanine carboxypeptidase